MKITHWPFNGKLWPCSKQQKESLRREEDMMETFDPDVILHTNTGGMELTSTIDPIEMIKKQYPRFPFLNPVLSPLTSGSQWRLMEDYWVSLSIGDMLLIPQGFETDFASVPRFFWRVLPPWDKHLRAALLHDFLYQDGRFSQAVCDEYFNDAMVSLGIAPWKRWLLYRAVKYFGGIAYRKHRARDKARGLRT